MPGVATQELNVFHFGSLEISVFEGWFELDPGLGMGLISHHGPKNPSNTQTHGQFANPLDGLCDTQCDILAKQNTFGNDTRVFLFSLFGDQFYLVIWLMLPSPGIVFANPASETVSEENLVWADHIPQFPCENPICFWLNVRCHVKVLAYLNLICFNTIQYKIAILIEVRSTSMNLSNSGRHKNPWSAYSFKCIVSLNQSIGLTDWVVKRN